MKKLWRVTVSRTEETEILVYAADEDEADDVASTNGADALDGCRSGVQEVEVGDPVEVDRFWPDPKLPINDRLRLSRTALPKDDEKDLPYGDMDDLEDELTAREILERLIAERVEREARAAEEAKQGKLFGGGA